uniref:Uncharacterized protein n=1 Tax=Parascaris univalens TaxID=6257 RepID=A0A915A4X0_PARUN
MAVIAYFSSCLNVDFILKLGFFYNNISGSYCFDLCSFTFLSFRLLVRSVVALFFALFVAESTSAFFSMFLIRFGCDRGRRLFSFFEVIFTIFIFNEVLYPVDVNRLADRADCIRLAILERANKAVQRCRTAD